MNYCNQANAASSGFRWRWCISGWHIFTSSLTEKKQAWTMPAPPWN